MVSFVQLLIVLAAVATSYGQVLNASTSAQDYYLISQRELLHEIEIVNLQIDAVDARYADRLDVIKFQQDQVLHEIVKVNKTLMPLQALSLVRKHCIQTYDSQLVTYDNAKAKQKVCYDQAVYTGNTLTTSPRSSANSAKIYVIPQLGQNVRSCDKSYSTNQTALDLCYISYVDSATTSVNMYLDSARSQLDKSLYDASVATQTAVKCSFAVEKDTLETMGQTSKLIDDCEAALNKKSTDAALSNIQTKSVSNLIMGKVPGQ